VTDVCDTLVVVDKDAVWFAKNSDREPGEAQAVEHRPRARTTSRRLRATYIEIDQVAETYEVALSRPAWMWGAEMGANEHGLAIGNEAVFTRVPVEDTGLLGMDLVRLALERCKTADEALDLVTWMIARHGQGGTAGFRDRGFRYHNAFLLADPDGAWLLETAGRFWAALRIDEGVRSTSNVLTIHADYTRLGPGTVEGARSLGLLRRGETFDFRRCFAAPVIGALSGGDTRRACTARAIPTRRPLVLADLARVVRDHAGLSPRRGARIVTPCAHASWLPTRGAGQTTGTQVSRLARAGSSHFFTGTSAPCISVLKPVPLGGDLVDTGPTPSARGFDGASLFWRSELLHRRVLRDYDARRATFEDDRAALEARATVDAWAEHRESVEDWAARAAKVRPRARRVPRPFDAWWRVQSLRDEVPR
jgi:secernin